MGDWGLKILKDTTTDYGLLVQTDGDHAIMVRNKAGTQKALRRRQRRLCWHNERRRHHNQRHDDRRQHNDRRLFQSQRRRRQKLCPTELAQSVTIEHDTNQIYFWNSTDSNYWLQMSNAGLVTSKTGSAVNGTSFIDSALI